MSTTRGRRGSDDVSVAPPGNVLLRAPTLSDAKQSICPSLHADDDVNLCVVSLSGTPDRILDTWGRYGGLPSKVGIVTADETRSAAAADTPSAMVGPDGTTVSTTTVSEPGDLTGIGIKVGQCLSAWRDDDATTVVCFDSLTTLLQYADLQRVFRFLHMLTRQIENTGALGSFHIDPAAHDDRAVSTVENLFSDQFEYDTETDSWDER
jgi:hypothetical protein